MKNYEVTYISIFDSSTCTSYVYAENALKAMATVGNWGIAKRVLMATLERKV